MRAGARPLNQVVRPHVGSYRMDPTAQFILAVFLVFYLLLVFGMSVVAPAQAMSLVVANAQSRAVFVVQILTRIMVGMAFVTLAPRLFLSPLFTVLGCTFAIVSAVLLLIPWDKHARAAERATHRLRPFVRYIGVASLVLGVTVVASFWCTAAGFITSDSLCGR